jgi:transposase-like protein
MKTNGIITYATKEAEQKYKCKSTTKKNKKSYCPSCELDLRNKNNYIKEKISENILIKQEI